MESVNISYRIRLDDRDEAFDFRLDADSFELISPLPENPPHWAELEFNKCSHCPLSSEEHSHCPVALRMAEMVERFNDTSSIDEVEMEVITEERRVIQKTVLQRAIASMLELVLPACGCPKTEAMRPLARFHLPLASEEENVFRVTGMYLLGQYFRSVTAQGGRIEFQGLIDLYTELNVLNKAIAGRIQSATRSDSVKNAIALLDMYSTLVPLLLEDELVEMRGFFKAFLPEETGVEAPAVTTSYLKSVKQASLELLPLDDAQDDDEPDWLKAARGEGEEAEAPAEPEEAPAEEVEDDSAVDEILKGSSLSLEPLDEKDDKPKTGRASFDVPED